MSEEQQTLVEEPQQQQQQQEQEQKEAQTAIEKQADSFLNKIYPYCTEITVGAVFGVCAGYFSKKFAEKSAYYVGGAFVGLQLLQYQGWVKLNYHKMQEDAVKALDADHDGKLTTNDLKIIFKKYLVVLGNKVPSSAGFAAAFFLGVRL